MQPHVIKMKIPHELPIILHKRLEDVETDIRRQAAIRYYKQRILSLGKAADLAGFSRVEFIDFLKFCGESVFDYTTDELEEIELDSVRLEEILNVP